MSHKLNLHTADGIIAEDPGLGILLAYGSAVPTGVGYAPGCKFILTTGSTIGGVSYVNIGTKAAANFQSVGLTGAVSASFVYGEATPIDASFFVADRNYLIQSIYARPLVVGSDGGAVTAQIRKCPSGTAAASGTVLHTGTIDLKGTIDTNQTPTLAAALGTRTIQNTYSLAFDVTGVMTAARGVISVLLLPL